MGPLVFILRDCGVQMLHRCSRERWYYVGSKALLILVITQVLNGAWYMTQRSSAGPVYPQHPNEDGTPWERCSN